VNEDDYLCRNALSNRMQEFTEESKMSEGRELGKKDRVKKMNSFDGLNSTGSRNVLKIYFGHFLNFKVILLIY